MSLENFIELCDTLSDEDIFIIGCQTVLRRENREKVERRSKYAAGGEKL
jgi:hypothetical protein